MNKEEAIKYLNEFILFKKISNTTEEEAIECFKLAIKALQQQPSEDEKIIRIKKGTLKARTGRYVIYDVEWLKTHFNTTEAKIYGQPQPKERTEEGTETHACDKKGHWIGDKGATVYVNSEGNVADFRACKCSECGEWLTGSDEYICGARYCPSCGAKMEEKK